MCAVERFTFLAIKDVLDPACDVDDELWVDTDVEQARGGAVSQVVTNVGQKTSHAQLIGYCKGYPKTKGYRIYSIDFPIPTIRSFGNILVSQDGRVRCLSVEKMARASSFTPRQVAHFKFLDQRGMGKVALKQIANAVPRGLLFTVYEVVVFELQRALDISGTPGTSYSLEVVDPKSITDFPQDLSQLYSPRLHVGHRCFLATV